MIRLGFLNTHPIQYYTPLFRKMAARDDIDLHVYSCAQASPQEQAAAGFGVAFDWDISLLGGYRHTFLENKAARPSTSGFRGMDIPGIGRQMENDRLDALIINGWHFKGAFQAMIAAWRRGIPVLLRSDSHLLTDRPASRLALKKIAYPRFIRRAEGLLAAGSLAREYFLHYGAPAERIFVVPHCVDDERISAARKELGPLRDEIRSAWQVGREDFVWLFAAKFIEKKRPMDFVRAIGEMARRNARCVGIMIGDGPMRGECEEWVKRNGIPVRFAGFLNQSEMVRGYVAGDALVVPSSAGETWGLVVNEAMLCGLPCFVSDQVGCAPDLVEQGRTGAVFPFGDPVACADVLQKHADGELLARMGAAARERCAWFSAENVAAAMADAVRTTLQRSRAMELCA